MSINDLRARGVRVHNKRAGTAPVGAVYIGQAAEDFVQQLSAYYATWSAVMKPRLYKDGNMWCALHGEDLQCGIAGFGPTPALALAAFDAAMCNENGAHNIERRPT